MHTRKKRPEPAPGTTRPVVRAPVISPNSGLAGGAMTPSTVLALQRSVGNRVVARMLAPAQDQDQHLHDAGCGHGLTAQRELAAPHSHDQFSSDHHPTAQRQLVDAALRSPGRPIEPIQRKKLESFHQTDLSHVRLHTGAVAQRSTEAIGAQAFTVGPDIVLGKNANNPRTLAHEASHVGQQSRGAVAGTDNGAGMNVSSPNDKQEVEASAHGDAFVSGVPHASSVRM